MNLVTIDEHSFDSSLLTKDSLVLDAGCRGFGFAKWLSENIGCYIECVDADPEIDPPTVKGMSFVNAVITDSYKETLKFYSFGNGTGSFSEECGSEPGTCKVFEVETFKINPFWDLIKLDIEGGEYDILMNMQRPISRQLSVEFHEHTRAKRGEEFIQKLFIHLSQWYEIIGANKEHRHGCGANYWDVLFKLKAGTKV